MSVATAQSVPPTVIPLLRMPVVGSFVSVVTTPLLALMSPAGWVNIERRSRVAVDAAQGEPQRVACRVPPTA